MATATLENRNKLGAVHGAENVDRDKDIIRGFVVAELGPFADGRGRFDLAALKNIVRLGNNTVRGLKVHMGHPTPFGPDQVPDYLGRARVFRMSTANGRNGRGDCVRADLHLDRAAHNSPKGDLAGYIMDRADSDPDSFASSLVLSADQQYELDSRGRPVRDADGNELPPLWMPTQLYAVDVVDSGAAVTSFLSSAPASLIPAVEGISLEASQTAAALLRQAFRGKPRKFVEQHVGRFIDRYLDQQFGPEPKPAPKRETRQTDVVFDWRCTPTAEQYRGLHAQLESIPMVYRRWLALGNCRVVVVEHLADCQAVPKTMASYDGWAGHNLAVVSLASFGATSSVLRHEIGHLVDDSFTPRLSDGPDVREMWALYRRKLDAYCGATQREFFAEMFAERYRHTDGVISGLSAEREIVDYFQQLEQRLAAHT